MPRGEERMGSVVRLWGIRAAADDGDIETP
jgi:hypothetical protein